MSQTYDRDRMGSPRKTRPLGTASWLALIAGMPMLFAPAALAQDAADPAEDSSEIIVTGTRISGFDAPTPVTTLSTEQLQSKSAGTIAELLDDVPQLRINQNIGKSSEAIGFSAVDLRGLTPFRSLVLIDDRRVGITEPQGNIDTNIVPVALIENIDIVTGGASAAYGSDAVAGVVNFRLDHDFEGAKFDVSYGQSEYDDFRRPMASFALGDSFMDGRLHLTFAGDYMSNDGQTDQASRPWGDDKTALLTNPAYTPTNGQPRLLIVENSVFSQMTEGGTITRTAGLSLASALGFPAGTGVQFGPNGQAIPFRYGTNIGGVYMTGGDGGSYEDEGNIQPEVQRWTAYGRASFELTPSVTFFTDLIYSHLQVDSDLAPNVDNGTLTIRNDNAFLPTNVRAAMATRNLTSFTFGRQISEDGFSIYDNQTDVSRWTFGLEGSFGDDWNWDITGQIGRSTYSSKSFNNRIATRWTNAVDAVLVNGVPVCRVKVTNPNANDATDPFRDIRDCVPANVFGAGSISIAAQNYYRGTSNYDSEQQQDVISANLEGRPFATWAGDVALAVGAEHRREETILTADPDSALSRWRSINTQPYSGEYTVSEGYAEVVVPLASEAPLAYNLEFNGAVRYTDYSTSGGVTTWKAGLNYEPIEGLRFRGTASRDIRAPNNNELFNRGNQVINTIIDPLTNIGRNTVQITSGNPNLVPEEADTITFGVIYQPTWLEGLRVAVDYYSIEIAGAITTIANQDIVNFCAAGRLEYCPNVIRDPVTNIITRINATPFNADALQTSGIDFEAQYRFDLGSGQVTLRGLANYVEELVTISNGVANDYVGLVGIGNPPQGTPQWRWNFDADYAIGPAKFGIGWRHVGGGDFDTRFNKTVLDLTDNTIGARGYLDLTGSYDITDTMTLYGRVENALSETPAIAPNSITQPTVANSMFYDKRGLYWLVGARVRFGG